MTTHRVVAHDEWLRERLELLEQEKEFTRLRDELSRRRRELPWERVEKDYVFDTVDGERSLGQCLRRPGGRGRDLRESASLRGWRSTALHRRRRPRP